MERLTVIGLEDELLIVETAAGARYAIASEQLPQPKRRPVPSHQQRKSSPREIQALIRGGMTASEVQRTTGDELDYIERFEGPVLAERAHVLTQAQSVQVTVGDIDPLANEVSFRNAIEQRLANLRASDIAWAAWKEADAGWIVQLRFTTEGNENDARWKFEPKKHTLSPANTQATSLSKHGDASAVLVPRLRAVDRDREEIAKPAPATAEPAANEAEHTPAAPKQTSASPARFDSGAFAIDRGDVEEPKTRSDVGVTRGPKAATEASHTADLLDALRRRRSEREAALAEAEGTGEATLFDDASETSAQQPTEEPEDDGRQHTSPLQPVRAKKSSRASMPSWDEIVFGARGDD